MDELEQAVQRGNEARQILVNPVFVAAKQSLKDKYLSDIVRSKEAEQSVREQAYIKLRVLDDVVSELSVIEQSGVVATHNLETKRRRRANT